LAQIDTALVELYNTSAPRILKYTLHMDILVGKTNLALPVESPKLFQIIFPAHTHKSQPNAASDKKHYE
jgi:hypothetical protein